MRKILLPLFAVLLLTACQKETISEQAKPQEEMATAAAAKGSDKITIWHYNASKNTWKQLVITSSAWAEHQAHGDIWKVGQDYKGGKIGYILQTGDPGYDANVPHGLIAAPNDLVSDPTDIVDFTRRQFYWCFSPQELPAEYQQVGPAARGTAIGTGAANTSAITQYNQTVRDLFFPGSNLSNRSANACSELELNGYSDWFLPSIDELQKIMISRNLIGGFFEYEPGPGSIYYFSSTEIGFDDFAYLQMYTCWYTSPSTSNSINVQVLNNSFQAFVRPVRYF